MSSDRPAKRPRRRVRVGKYEVVRHIATGGMGAVYRAIDTDLKREVALKVLPPELAAKPAALERFRREARHAARLRHENIVTIYEINHASGTYYLAMEFVDGIDLHEYINRKGRLEPEEARIITIQAARALDHAHKQGIVHRDIKPSNFLITRKADKLLIKLSDFGLARETADEEARVTRAGTTVGTVDYISPEQARDAGLADTRSDIYSLGCTLYHMVAGSPPFPEGSIPERLYKHVHEEPPDLRQANPRVSEAMCAVVRRMLAKRPEDRYQTPAELLKDLLQIESVAAPISGRDVLAGLALAEDESPREEAPLTSSGHRPPAPPSSRTMAATARRVPGRRRDDEESKDPTSQPPRAVPAAPLPALWFLVGGGILFVLALVVVILAMLSRNTTSPGPEEPRAQGSAPGVEAPAEEGPSPPPDTSRAPPHTAPRRPPVPPETRKPEWPSLYNPQTPIDRDRLRQEFAGDWPKDWGPPADAPVYRVARMPAGDTSMLPSLVAACAAAPPGRWSIIEIHDNGPIWVPSIAVTGRHLCLRPGKGFRPLLVWEVAPRSAEGEGRGPSAAVPGPPRSAPCFLTVHRGHLVLEGLEVGVRWTAVAVPDRVHLFRVADGDFLARDCIFSIAGRHGPGIGLVRLERTPSAGPPPSTGNRCRLSRCYARGASLVALDLDSPNAEVHLDRCLVVGHEQPLVQVAGRNLVPNVLRVFRSTLIGGNILFEVRRAGSSDVTPQVHVRAWDALFARGGTLSGGDMVVLPGGANMARMSWQAVNCLYAGWKRLLVAADATAADMKGWQECWRHGEGDHLVAPVWPAILPNEPADVLPAAYQPTPAPATPVGYAATSGPGPLGHDPASLPPVRDNWLGLTFDPFPMPMVDLLVNRAAPDIPPARDGRFHGAAIDLETTDLGAYLQEMQKRPGGLGPRVVLHLRGSGERRTRPIRIKGTRLVLYFEPPEREGAPLVLVPHDTAPAPGEALIEVEGGGLEMIGGGIRFPDYRLALLPPYLLKVRGDLRLFRCRLQGPLMKGPDSYRGLIRWQGSGEADRARVCALNEVILVSGKDGLHSLGGGAQLRMSQCVLVAGGNAIHFEPGSAVHPRMNVHAFLENVTVAARGAVLRLDDAPQLGVPAEPIVVRTRACAFLQPFSDAPLPPTLLAVAERALGRGLLVWQGEGNAFDKRMGREVQSLSGGVSRPQPGLTWPRLFGSAWERQQIFDVVATSTIDWGNPRLDRLAVPGKPPQPGADLEFLGLAKKP